MTLIQRVERANDSDWAMRPMAILMPDVAGADVVQSVPVRSAVDAPEKAAKKTWQPYPNFKVIVLDDDFNTFEHVSTCLLKYIPHLNADRAWALTNQVHHDGQAIVWIGPQEQAELYHMQLGWEGLTMAPLEAA
ncbi:ATP-dependent Clp protease adapter ClpS [filamentous cyanobacterium LEGE 11480]|uniref:ATP-dependent Clp protease adapter ClpS n=1 Tax=Romeriopsis navalis LEGE 11480 TaxID=2777977 RepID=A0A928VHP1_9CYAN|nr:ATP-dependent Clp protease adapter ClpS [Romeriopsis navalis]MBE9028791.1 ATP-dependent Clp protease adapter ClpS [Romeriopsis navalis LEGE 11480]